jgi:DNA polymerase I-like protein with 3'-5' exonuclease and polymerase domains
MEVPRLSEFPVIAIDTETTGLHWWKDKVFGISVSTPGGQDWYWDIREEPRAVEFLRDEIPKCQWVVAHNAKFDWHMLRCLGINLPRDRTDDTMIRAAIIDEHLLSYDLGSLGHKYVGAGKDEDIWQELADIFGGKPTKHAQVGNLPRAPRHIVARYAKMDTRVTLMLWQHQNTLIEEQNLQAVCDLERRLLPVIVDMELGGVKVNTEMAEQAVVKISSQASTAQYQLDSLAGFAVNPNPSGSIKKLFEPKQDKAGNWVLNDGTVAGTTEAGGVSIDASVLRRMKHPAASVILKLRKLLKTRDTFLKGHILGHHHNGVIHANYNQTKSDNDLGTGTGRLSVNDPALQQIHKRDTEIASVVRAMFLPDSLGHDWVCNDWAQMDFRVFAHYVNDPAIIAMYRKDPDTDFHQVTSDLTGLPRSPRFAGDANAKQINLGLVFGMGQGKLAQEMGLPFTVEPNTRTGGTWNKPGAEALEVFNKYHSSIPGVQELLRNASSVAKSRGYVRTIIGRRIRFPKGQFTHKAGGLIFQGSAADALKVKIIEVHDYLSSLNDGSRLVLNVHDEFDTSILKGNKLVRDEISRIVTDFSGPIKFRVPIRTDQGVADNWWDACK